MVASSVVMPLGENASNARVPKGTVEGGDANAAESLLTIVYDELRRLAAYKMTHEAPGQTLQPTALVHEVWLKLVGVGEPNSKIETTSLPWRRRPCAGFSLTVRGSARLNDTAVSTSGSNWRKQDWPLPPRTINCLR